MPVKRPRSPEESIHLTIERAFEEKAREDVRRIRQAFLTMSRGLIAGAMVSHLVATVALALVVFSEPFPYPAMYLLMGLLLWLVAAIRFTAWTARRRISAAMLLVASVLMNIMWIAVIVDQIPAQNVVSGTAISRPDLPVLWVPVGLYMLSIAFMLAHAFIHIRRPRRV